MKEVQVSCDTPTMQTLVDSYGDISTIIKAHEKDKDYVTAKAALKTVKEDILKTLTVQDSEQAVLSGEEHSLKIGAKTKVRKVSDIYKIKAMLGEQAFMSLVSLKLGDLDDYLTPEQRAEVLTESFSGARKITVVS